MAGAKTRRVQAQGLQGWSLMSTTALWHNCDCAGVSGERIWVEIKKIAMGRFADSIFSVMEEFGVTSHIGWYAEIMHFIQIEVL